MELCLYRFRSRVSAVIPLKEAQVTSAANDSYFFCPCVMRLEIAVCLTEWKKEEAVIQKKTRCVQTKSPNFACYQPRFGSSFSQQNVLYNPVLQWGQFLSKSTIDCKVKSLEVTNLLLIIVSKLLRPCYKDNYIILSPLTGLGIVKPSSNALHIVNHEKLMSRPRYMQFLRIQHLLCVVDIWRLHLPFLGLIQIRYLYYGIWPWSNISHSSTKDYKLLHS